MPVTYVRAKVVDPMLFLSLEYRFEELREAGLEKALADSLLAYRYLM